MISRSTIKIKTSYRANTQRIKPDKPIRKLLHFFNPRIFSDKLSIEQFPIAEIITNLKNAFLETGIRNIVSISKDFNDIHIDRHNKPDDFEQEMDNFITRLSNEFFGHYEYIQIISEATFNKRIFTFEVLIKRIHLHNEYPVEIRIVMRKPYEKDTTNEKKQTHVLNLLKKNLLNYIIFKDFITEFYHENPYFDKKPEVTIPVSDHVKTEDLYAGGNILFPVSGVVLGLTTVKELQKNGVKATDTDSEGKIFKFYKIDNFNFWYTDTIANRMYLTKYDEMPGRWRSNGFDWELSYHHWYRLLEELDFKVIVRSAPQIIKYQGFKSFDAELKGIIILDNIRYELVLGFRYSNKTKLDDKGTLYNLSMVAV